MRERIIYQSKPKALTTSLIRRRTPLRARLFNGANSGGSGGSILRTGGSILHIGGSILSASTLILAIGAVILASAAAWQPAQARKPEPVKESLPQAAIDALSQGSEWQPDSAPKSFIRRRRNTFDSLLKLQCEDAIPVDQSSYAKLAALVEAEPRKLSPTELMQLNSLIPEGNPQLSGEGADGETRYLAGREMVLLWTITKTIGPCQPTGENASRRPLLNQMDLWVFLPLVGGESCQRLHFYVESAQNPLSEISALERFIQAAALSNECEQAFDLREGRVIFQARARGKTTAQATSTGKDSTARAGDRAADSTSLEAGTELTASILRRIGTKPIPFFHVEIPGAYNPRLLTSANWRQNGKPAVVLVVNFGAIAQSAYLYTFTASKVEALQELSAQNIEISQDLGQKGIQTTEAIEGSGLSHDRFYIFSNSTGRLTELLSARKRLAENVLRQMRYENDLAAYPPENKLGVASLLIDAEEPAKAETILAELTDKKDKTIDHKVAQAAQKLLKSLRTASPRGTQTRY